MTTTKNMADTREDIRTAIFSLCYQAEAEAEWGDADSPMTAQQIERIVQSLVFTYGRLTTAVDAVDVSHMAWRDAHRRVHGD